MRRHFSYLAVGAFLLCSSALSQWVQTNGPCGGDIRCLAVSGTYLFAGTYYGGVFRSTNGGASWTAANAGLTSTHIHALAVSGTDLFAGTGGGGVFRSTDNGTSWIAVNSGLTNPDIRSLAVSPAGDGLGTATLFAGTSGSGVFRSTDTGRSWTGTDLTNACITSFAVTGTNVFAGEPGIGGG